MSRTDTISWRECSKKHALSLSEGSIQQGRSPFDARSVLIVREHDKRARTPLAAFCNIPLLPTAEFILGGKSANWPSAGSLVLSCPA